MKNHTSTALADDEQEDSNAGHRRTQSDRKCAQAARKESEEGFRTLCEASLAGIYIVQNGCIKYANPALAGILAYQPEELHRMSWSVLVHPDDRPVVEEHHRRRLTGDWQASRYEVRCVRKDGEVIHFEVLGSRIEYAGRPSLIGTMLDISDRKRAEAVMADRVLFEQLLADLSATFVNVPSERLDESIENSLKMLVEFLGNDRSTLVRLTEDPKHILVTHSYAVPGCEPFPLGPLADNQLPWYIGQFRSGKMVFAAAHSRGLAAGGRQGTTLLPGAWHPVQRGDSAQGGRRGPGRDHLRVLEAALRVARGRLSAACN